MSKSLRDGNFISVNLINNPLASCSLINLEFLLPQISQFDESIILLLFIFSTFDSLLSVSFLHFKQ